MQHKVFRIEQTAGYHGERRRLATPTRGHDVAQVSDIIARHKRDLAALINEGQDRRMTRAAGELGAAVENLEKATQNILKTTESIDEGARALAAVLSGDFERSLAQDIQDHVVKLYEACNFHDLAGQRIGKVIEMLGMVETEIAAMLARCNGHDVAALPPATPGNGLINGPKLDGASGHVSQREIDMLFA